uniref:Chemerin chemokine-like receptor 1 n=1 Tax=Paramormyrops kingsleyae TaxID=1676925 RepID=A0A3B3QJ03_9TELE
MALIPNDSGYDYNEDTDSGNSCQWDCVILVVVNIIICVLGLSGNGLVIWIAGLKMKKTVNTTWYLSLAISDFLYCIFLPVNTAYLATNNWIFGLSMCKFTSFVMFLNMFSSISLLVIISIDRCVSVVFPVWAQNKRTVKKASLVIILVWIISIALSSPSAIFRKTIQYGESIKCYNNYELHSNHLAVVLSRFVCGFLLPFLIIISCYSVIICKLRSSRMTKSSKPFKVMSALIGAFFICWLPYHIVLLMETNEDNQQSEIFQICTKVFPVLANANSVLNPLLYAFMGRDFKHKCWRFAVSKIENALASVVSASCSWQSYSHSH